MATHTTAARNAQADAIAVLVDVGAAGKIVGKTADGGTTLFEITLEATAFDAGGTAGAGIITAQGFPKTDSSANATGTCAWYEVQDGSGTRVIYGNSVAAGSGELNMVTTSVVATQPVTINSFIYTVPAS